jgi:hypothetical protein
LWSSLHQIQGLKYQQNLYFRNDCLSPQNQLLFSLRFYAIGAWLETCGVHK